MCIEWGDKSQSAERNVRVLVDKKLSMSQQCTLADKRSSYILECMQCTIAQQWKGVIVSQYSIAAASTPILICSFEPHNIRI